MARKLTAREALARAIACEIFMAKPWDDLWKMERATIRREASRHIRRLAAAGFTIVPCKPSRKGRKA